MGSKLKRLRKREIVVLPGGKGSVTGDDGLMLTCAKQLARGEGTTREMARDDVIVMCDVRDDVGAYWAASVHGMTVDELRDSMLATDDGEANPMPFMAFWVPRAKLIEVLTALSFGVPPDWAPRLAAPPRPNYFYVMLKRRKAGMLVETDFEGLPDLSAPMVAVGRKSEPVVDDNDNQDEDGPLLDHMLGGLGARCSDETRRLVVADYEQFMTWWREKDINPDFPYYQHTPDEFAAMGWTPDAPATDVASERGLSPAAATSVLRDVGATPADACNMDGDQFAAKFGDSWFDILPRVNG